MHARSPATDSCLDKSIRRNRDIIEWVARTFFCELRNTVWTKWRLRRKKLIKKRGAERWKILISICGMPEWKALHIIYVIPLLRSLQFNTHHGYHTTHYCSGLYWKERTPSMPPQIISQYACYRSIKQKRKVGFLTPLAKAVGFHPWSIHMK